MDRDLEPEPSRNAVSIALLAAVACVPIVIAAGFLTELSPKGSTASALPSDISVFALRGGLDAGPDRRRTAPVRAGY